MKGIILAGGLGTRLYPTTKVVSKQLLPVYDKPLIYYPLTTLMLAGIKDILIITKPDDLKLFSELLGDGRTLGINIKFAAQEKPNGIPEALIIGKEFIGQDRFILILGDNIFHSDMFINRFIKPSIKTESTTIFGYHVSDPERYGVLEFDKSGSVIGIEEKPKKPKSKFAVTGLYIFNADACNLAKTLTKSYRNEFEIIDILNYYLYKNQLHCVNLGRGVAWLDTGTSEALAEASKFVEVYQKRQGMMIGCIEEAAYQQGWISKKQLVKIAEPMSKTEYGRYLLSLQ